MTTYEPSMRGVTRGAVFVAVLTLILVACSGTAASPPPSASAPPASDAPIDLPTGAPPTTLSFDDLAGGLVDLDGTTVTVAGYLRISDDRAQLCGVLLESYPPQCGAVTFRVIGEVPADVIDGLETTTGDDVSKAWWGTVQISGLVAADGGDGSPTVTIDAIELVEGL